MPPSLQAATAPLLPFPLRGCFSPSPPSTVLRTTVARGRQLMARRFETTWVLLHLVAVARRAGTSVGRGGEEVTVVVRNVTAGWSIS
ncbi:rna-binding protein rnc1 [Sesbania bispinosa]|nr:rna-binding protein rnc1 [Sesbania bispinosa]